MTVYQIPGWDHHFENFKSRTIDECSYVAMPNKQHGLGLTRILAEPDGSAIFGIWCLILQAASRQERPRAGWLTVNGKPDGAPWDIDDMALRWRRTSAEVIRAIEVLTSAKVGWITAADAAVTAQHPPGIRTVSAEYPIGALEGKEGKEGKEQRTNAPETFDPSAPPSEQPPATDADRWRMEQGLSWSAGLKTAGCKIGPQNWPAWKGLVERHGNQAVREATTATKPDERWPDAVEKAILAKTATTGPPNKYANRPAKTMQVTP